MVKSRASRGESFSSELAAAGAGDGDDNSSEDGSTTGTEVKTRSWKRRQAELFKAQKEEWAKAAEDVEAGNTNSGKFNSLKGMSWRRDSTTSDSDITDLKRKLEESMANSISRRLDAYKEAGFSEDSIKKIEEFQSSQNAEPEKKGGLRLSWKRDKNGAADLSKLQDELKSEDRARIKKLEEENSKLRSEVDSLKKQVDELQKKLTVLEKTKK